jgi:phosphonate transport system substrate-binding protein
MISRPLARRFRRGAALASVALMAVGVAACSSDANAKGSNDYAVNEDTLVFGVVPDSVDTETNYQPLMDYIAEETGKKVEYHESTDYAALIEASIAGKIDVASFSGFTYVTATNKGAELTPVSSIITEKGQEPGYYSEAIAPKDSDIESVKDFKGKKVCFVDPSSTSGYLFPSYNLLEDDIDPEKDITPVFAGKHDVSVKKTAEGTECEAGFAEDVEVEKNKDVKVVDRTLVPGAPIVVANHLPDDAQKELTDLLKEVSVDDIVKAGVKSADTDAFRQVFAGTAPVDDEYYDQIRTLCKETKAEQCTEG